MASIGLVLVLLAGIASAIGPESPAQAAGPYAQMRGEYLTEGRPAAEAQPRDCGTGQGLRAVSYPPELLGLTDIYIYIYI